MDLFLSVAMPVLISFALGRFNSSGSVRRFIPSELQICRKLNPRTYNASDKEATNRQKLCLELCKNKILEISWIFFIVEKWEPCFHQLAGHVDSLSERNCFTIIQKIFQSYRRPIDDSELSTFRSSIKRLSRNFLKFNFFMKATSFCPTFQTTLKIN